MFFGTVVYSLAQWGVLVFINKLGSTSMVGQYALGLSIAAPIVVFLNLNLRTLVATDAGRQYSFREYVSLRIITSVIATFTILIVALFVGDTVITKLVVFVIGVSKAFEAISDVIFGYFQFRERMDLVAKSLILKGALTLLAFTTGLYLSHNTLGGAVGLTVAWALLLSFYDVRNLRKLWGSLNASEKAIEARRHSLNCTSLMNLVWTALPSGTSVLLGSLTVNFPRYMIAHFIGTSELGIFVSMSYLMVAGDTVINSLGQAASPRLAKHFASGNLRMFKSLLFRLITLGFLVGLAGILIVLFLGRWILVLLYSVDYIRHEQVFLCIMVATAISYSFIFLGTALNAMREYKAQFLVNCFTCVTVLLSSFLLVPSYGMIGGAYAMILGSLSTASGYAIQVQRILRKRTTAINRL
jgi:O-antigen/teichoic acid export membrane protein